MMSLSYVEKYCIVCYFVLIIVINAVAVFSHDYYFGMEPLSSKLSSDGSILVKDCDGTTMKYQCYKKCGVYHLCILGQCVCFKVLALPKVKDLPEEESSEEDTTREEFFDTVEEHAIEHPSTEESNNSDEELVNPAALRHHIAHFCPNLNAARQCIRKCMNFGLPAFCGKDHNCYCGHKYEYSGKDPEIDPKDIESQFKDLYEKYFGPKSSNASTTTEPTY